MPYDELVLTDTEKLIISALVIRKQQRYVMGDFKRTEILKQYSTAFQVENKVELYLKLKKEEEQLKNLLALAEYKKALDFDPNYTNLTEREKYVFYQVELMLVYNLPEIMQIAIQSFVNGRLNVFDDEEIFKLVEEHVNEVFKFIEFILKQKN